MSAQRAVHRLMTVAREKMQHLGFVYRIDRVTRTGRVLDSEYVDYAHDVCWC
jgi:hypothetical protein